MPPESSSPFAVPVRGAYGPDRILVVIDEAQRDPLLDRYIETMAGHSHPCEVLAVPPQDPVAARLQILQHPGIRDGSIRGIQLFGKTIPSFRLLKLDPTDPTRISRVASDLPYGSDIPAFDAPLVRDDITDSSGIRINDLAQALPQLDADFRLAQWVARIVRLDEQYLENLATSDPPQVNNRLIVNADPVFDDVELTARIRAVTEAFRLLPASVYNDKTHFEFQILAGHSIFGDGTSVDSNHSFA